MGLLAFLLTGCALFEEEPAATPKLAGGTLTIGVGPIGPLDPADASGAGLGFLRAACNGILSLDDSTAQARRDLASEWKVTDGGKSVSLTLAKGAKFHDGTSVDARAIAANLSRVARPVTQSIWASLLAPIAGFAEVQSGAVADLSGIKVIDEVNLELSLTTPAADLPASLAHPGLVPVSTAELSKDPEEGVLPVCSGPYKVESTEGAGDLRLTRDKSYKGEVTGADVIVVRAFETQDEAFEAYRRGEVDASVVPVIRALEVPEAERLVRTTSEVTFIAFDPAKPESSSPKFRQALSLAIDRGAIIDAAYDDGRQAIIRWLGVDTVVGSSCAEFGRRRTSDSPRAQQLFGEAGGQAGMKIPLIFDSSVISGLVAQSIRVQAKDGIGLDLESQPMDTPAFGQSIVDRPHAAAWIMTITPDVPVPTLLLESLFANGGKGNLWGFSNEEFEALIAQARGTVKDPDREELYKRAEDVVCNQMQAIPLWTGVSHWAANPAKIVFDSPEEIDVFGQLLLRHARSSATSPAGDQSRSPERSPRRSPGT